MMVLGQYGYWLVLGDMGQFGVVLFGTNSGIGSEWDGIG